MWKTKKLSELCYIHTGNSINEKIKRKKYTNLKSGVPYIGTKDIGFDGSINYDNNISIPDTDSNKFKISKANSVLVCVEGGSAGRKIAYSNKKCHFGNKLCSLEPKENLNPKFLYYYTLGNEFQFQFKENLSGLIGGVSISKIKSFNISFPILSGQSSIVSNLEKIFNEIDNSINISKKKIDKLIDLKNSILISKLEQK